MVQAIIFLVDGVEELEAVAPVDCLRRAGVEVELVAVQENLEIRGRNGLRLLADRHLAEAGREEADLLLVPGGPGHKTLRADRRLLDLLRRQIAAGRDVGAICAGPTVLMEAGLLDGRRYTAHFSTAEELPDAAGEAVVEDGPLITSQGAGTAVEFGLCLVRRLCGEQASADVRAAICAPTN